MGFNCEGSNLYTDFFQLTAVQLATVVQTHVIKSQLHSWEPMYVEGSLQLQADFRLCCSKVTVFAYLWVHMKLLHVCISSLYNEFQASNLFFSTSILLYNHHLCII